MPSIIIPQNDELLLPRGTTLPPASAEKLVRLETELADWQGLTSTTMTRLRTLEEQTLEAQQQLSDAKRGNNTTWQKNLETKIEGLMVQRRELSPLLAKRNGRSAELLAIVTRLREWAEKLPSGTRFDAAPKQDVGGGPVTAADIEAIRTEISELESARYAAHSAPAAADELKAKIKAGVEEMVAGVDRSKPNMTRFLSGTGPIDAPYIKDIHHTAGVFRFDGDSNVLALLAWFAPDQLIARLSDEVDANRGDPKSELTDAQRVQRLGEIDAALLALDRREEALIEAARKEGQDIPRRPSASPLALLGIVLAKPSSGGGAAFAEPPMMRDETGSDDDGFVYGKVSIRRVAE